MPKNLPEPIAADLTLAQAEAFIEDRLMGAAEVMAMIRDRRLYRETHERWEDYVKERWNLSKSAADRQINQWRAFGELPAGSDLPPQPHGSQRRRNGARTSPLPGTTRDTRAISGPPPPVIDVPSAATDTTHPPPAPKVVEASSSEARPGRAVEAAPTAAQLADRLAEQPPMAWLPIGADRLRALRSLIDAQLLQRGEATDAPDPAAARLAQGVREWADRNGASFDVAVDRVLARLVSVSDPPANPRPAPARPPGRTEVRPSFKGGKK